MFIGSNNIKFMMWIKSLHVYLCLKGPADTNKISSLGFIYVFVLFQLLFIIKDVHFLSILLCKACKNKFIKKGSQAGLKIYPTLR
jgi:hypothetical protein